MKISFLAVVLLFLAMAFHASAQSVILVPKGPDAQPPLGTTYKGGSRTLTMDGSGDQSAYDSQSTPTFGNGISDPAALVPEPTSIYLLLAAGAGAVGLKIRRKKS